MALVPAWKITKEINLRSYLKYKNFKTIHMLERIRKCMEISKIRNKVSASVQLLSTYSFVKLITILNINQVKVQTS